MQRVLPHVKMFSGFKVQWVARSCVQRQCAVLQYAVLRCAVRMQCMLSLIDSHSVSEHHVTIKTLFYQAIVHKVTLHHNHLVD